MTHLAEWPEVLPSTSPMVDLEAVAAALHRDLVRRFRGEESPGGGHERLCRAAPGFISLVATLRGEHRVLLDAVESLRVRIVAGRPDDRHVLITRLASVLGAVEDHEELERYATRHALD